MVYERSSQARCFMTPPPPPSSWKSRPFSRSPTTTMPLSEKKKSPASVNKGQDLYHVIHKVPSGDSPYVKAKQVQLVEKDPSKAISLFWASINAGDRVESALKDMALVMKQLNRSDEAIEAVKSFRHLCPSDSQESLDNILVELYKRSGRVDEEIAMLHHKLKQIEDGATFVGRTTKQARSQGKKIQITAEQEISRILGNLAWAYLQKGDYEIAEVHYRKALSLEVDRNKQCNLAICLMQQNKIIEAKFLLNAVCTATKNKKMDDSFANSFDRASEMLQEMESSPNLENSSGKSRIENSFVPHEVQASHWSRRYETPDPKVPYTKQKRSSWGFSNGSQRETWRDVHSEPKPSFRSSPNEKVSYIMRPNSTQNNVLPAANPMQSAGTMEDTTMHEDTTARSRGLGPLHNLKTEAAMKFSENDISATKHEVVVDGTNSFAALVESDQIQGNTKSLQKKSWADIVEEEEEFFSDTSFHGLNGAQVFNDENSNSNIVHQLPSWSRNPTVRRSLCFDPELTKERGLLSREKQPTRRNRLQVFQDITPFPEAPRMNSTYDLFLSGRGE